MSLDQLKKDLIVIVVVSMALTISGCQKSENQITPNGTVDGGGGNVLCEKNGKSCSILDLVESKDRTPFDFDMRTIAQEEFKEDFERIQKNMSATILYNGNPDLKAVFKENTDFMIWYLNQIMMSNKSFDSSDKSLRFIGAEAFGVSSEKVKNIQFYFTEKEIPLLKDQGYLNIENPEDLKQVALQDGLGQVLVQKEFFSKMNFKNKYALKLHEALLFVLIQMNKDHLVKNGTSKIRQFVNLFMAYNFEKATKGSSDVNSEKVAEAFKALDIPIVKARYNLIGEISDTQNSREKICVLKRKSYQMPDGSFQESANYYFVRNEEVISNEYAMDIEFLMKIQIYLVNRGLCIFKPTVCEIKWVTEQSQEMTGYAVHVQGKPLPEVNKDLAHVQEFVLPKYKQARICQ